MMAGDDKQQQQQLPKKKATPKTVLDKIVAAIRALSSNKGGGGSKGCSRVSIQKYLQSEFDYDNSKAIKLALQKGVKKSKVLVQTGQSFRVAADPIIEPEEESGGGVQQEDLVIGGNEKDAAAQNGDEVTVAYRGTLLDDGYEFDKASSFTFVLGAGDVIKGWDLGIVGMKKGGKRK